VNDLDNAWLFDVRWGVDVMLPAATPLISLIEEAAGLTDTVALVRLSRAGVSVIETVLTATSRTTGRVLADMSLPAGVLIAAVVRSGEPLEPEPELRLQAGDEVLIVSRNTTAEKVHSVFQ
jgi:trk system potassium uptake protein